MEQLPLNRTEVGATPPQSEDIVKPKARKRLWLIGAGLVAIGLVLSAIYISHSRQPRPVNESPIPTTKTAPLAPPQIKLALFASGLPNPTAIASTNQAADRRLFVTDRDGFIRIVKADGSVASQPFLDISNQVLSDGEMGLLGLAFAPDYAESGYFFINYIDKGQNSVIARLHVSADANKADPASRQTLLIFKQPYTNHNGGDLVFGPDGYLYATFGDGGSAGDPGNRAQNLNTLFGKILRLDVSQVPYKIPASNPFANQAGKSPEIWDYGLRNPWRISFDRQTHKLYIADVGQDNREEINVEPAGNKGGNNYGWRCYEGNQDYNLAGCQSRDAYAFPVSDYDHSQDRCSITGGYVYRGQKNQALIGKYFYGDYCGGQLYWLEQKNTQWQSNLAAKTTYKISTFGQDSQGELYLADFKTGNIYQIQDMANK